MGARIDLATKAPPRRDAVEFRHRQMEAGIRRDIERRQVKGMPPNAPSFSRNNSVLSPSRAVAVAHSRRARAHDDRARHVFAAGTVSRKACARSRARCSRVIPSRAPRADHWSPTRGDRRARARPRFAKLEAESSPRDRRAGPPGSCLSSGSPASNDTMPGRNSTGALWSTRRRVGGERRTHAAFGAPFPVRRESAPVHLDRRVNATNTARGSTRNTTSQQCAAVFGKRPSTSVQ